MYIRFRFYSVSTFIIRTRSYHPVRDAFLVSTFAAAAAAAGPDLTSKAFQSTASTTRDSVVTTIIYMVQNFY